MDTLDALLSTGSFRRSLCSARANASNASGPASMIMSDYVYWASSAVKGGTVTIGYPYGWPGAPSPTPVGPCP
jgi:hypothetical protein